VRRNLNGRKVEPRMAPERDFDARIERIELLMAEARHLLTTSVDPKNRAEMRARLRNTLKELGARVPVELFQDASIKH
jgi:hypothetical protein